LFVYELKKRSFRQILEGFEGAFEAVGWKGNSEILFVASESTSTTLGTVSVKGNGLKRILDKKRMSFSTVSIDQNGSLAFAASAAAHPSELFYLGSDMEDPQRLTDSNPWLAQRKTGVQEIVRYRARDGFEVEGVLIRPVDEVPGSKYPLILYVHGGPESHENDGWLTSYSRPGQVAAGMGYAVFYPNYRGSTGRGLEVAMSSQGDPAGKEFDDIIDGVDHLVETGLVDADKVGVTGGSYGGYATAWMATRHTDRFAAGVMSVGISDNISKWGTSDIPEEMYLVHSRKRIWEDYEFFLKRSPIYYAGEAKTPLLILHGENDTRVDPGQSKELYRHIKTRTDTPVRLVLYPGEGHGNRKSTARFDYNCRMLQWFDHYLQGAGSAPPKYIHLELEAQ
jgi:dipeptidyl aminopeptidase/acylaminoacyl peptidase